MFIEVLLSYKNKNFRVIFDMLLIKALPVNVFQYIEMVQMKHIHKLFEFLINKNTAEQKISLKKPFEAGYKYMGIFNVILGI